MQQRGKDEYTGVLGPERSKTLETRNVTKLSTQDNSHQNRDILHRPLSTEIYWWLKRNSTLPSPGTVYKGTAGIFNYSENSLKPPEYKNLNPKVLFLTNWKDGKIDGVDEMEEVKKCICSYVSAPTSEVSLDSQILKSCYHSCLGSWFSSCAHHPIERKKRKDAKSQGQT